MSAKAPSFPMIAQEARRLGLRLESFDPQENDSMEIVDKNGWSVIRVSLISQHKTTPSEARRMLMGALKALPL